MITNKQKYKGVVIPAVTPLTGTYKLDHGALEKMFHLFRQNHTMPFINGTTGESASLPLSLKKELIIAGGKLKVTGEILFGGISANSLDESVDLAKLCFDNGADAVAATLPSYYTLSDSQIKKYFEQLAEKISGPLIIYNIPVTTHMSIPLGIIDELSHHENIIGTKDSERNDERLQTSLELWADRDDFCHFLGWASQSATALINGSDGIIPSTGNLFPGIYCEMYKAVADGDHERAYHLQSVSDTLGDIYQKGKLLGESLWSLKVLMQELGICQEYVMSPLKPLTSAERERMIEAMHHVREFENLAVKNDV